VDATSQGQDLEATLPFIKKFLEYAPLSRFEYTSTSFSVGSLSPPTLCQDYSEWIDSVLFPALEEVESKVLAYTALKLHVIGLPAYSVVLAPYLLGNTTYSCTTNNGSQVTKTALFFEGKNINTRFPDQLFVVTNPATSSVELVKNIARLGADTITLSDPSLLRGNLEIGFGASPLSELSKSDHYQIFIVQQGADSAAISASASYISTAIDAGFVLGTSIHIFDIFYTSAGDEFDRQALKEAAQAIATFAGDSNLNHALVLISVNGALGDSFTSSAITSFFGFPINNTIESQSNVKYLSINYGISAVAPPVQIEFGLQPKFPYFSYELKLAGYSTNAFANRPNGSTSYIDVVKFVSKCWWSDNLPIFPSPYTATGGELRFIGNTAVSQWLQSLAVGKNSLTSPNPDRGYQINGLWAGSESAIPY